MEIKAMYFTFITLYVHQFSNIRHYGVRISVASQLSFGQAHKTRLPVKLSVRRHTNSSPV